MHDADLQLNSQTNRRHGQASLTISLGFTAQRPSGRRETYARSTALYSSPREFESQYFFIHCRNSRLSCILHLTSRSTGMG